MARTAGQHRREAECSPLGYTSSTNGVRCREHADHLARAVAEQPQRLVFTTELASAVGEADAVFIAVGTPSRRGDGCADLSYVYAARDIAATLSGFTVVISKSTVPVGTGDEIDRIIRATRPDADFAVVSNPEFLREGAAIRDFKLPDRIVIGTEDEPRSQSHGRIVSAALSQLVADPLHQPPYRRANQICRQRLSCDQDIVTFINEIADLCEQVGADVQEVARGIGLDNRIGSKFLHAGPGFGGACFPKDALALIKTAQDYASPLRIVETVVAVNDACKRLVARKVSAALGGRLRDRTIAVLGLTFKPNTDDMRDAPSIPLITALIDRGAKGESLTLSAWNRPSGHCRTSPFSTDPMSAPRAPTRLSL